MAWREARPRGASSHATRLTQRGARLGFSGAKQASSPAHALLGPLGQPLAVWPMGLGRSSTVGRGRGNQWVDAKSKHMMLWTQRKLASQPAATIGQGRILPQKKKI